MVEAWLGEKSPATARAYLADLGLFAQWYAQAEGIGLVAVVTHFHGLDGSEPVHFQEETRPPAWTFLDRFLSLDPGRAHELALRYRNALVSAGLASATIARRLASLKSAVKLARQTGRIGWALDVSRPRAERREDRAGPDDATRKRLWKHLRKGDGPAERRDRAVFALLFDLALRRNEVVSLGLADVDMRAGELAVLRKGRRERLRLKLPPQTRRELEAWIAVRGMHDGPLFHRLDRPGHGALTGEAVRLLVMRAAQGAGVAVPVRPHGLRHAAITKGRDLGKSALDLREFGGHAKLETTMLYLDRPGEAAFDVANSVARERGR